MVEGVKADYIPIGPEQRLEPAEQQNWHRGRGCRGGRERAAYKEGKRKKNMEHEETEGKQEGRELEMVKAEKYGMAFWT